MIHGQFTVPNGTSGYQNEATQVGKASNVSSGAITVTSVDGYVHTYTVTAQTVVDSQRDGISTVASGDTVRVLATTANGHDTATSVVDTTKLAASGFARRGPAGVVPAPGTAPSTNPGSTPSTA